MKGHRAKRHLLGYLFVLASLLSLTTGCWDQLPFPDRAEALVLTADPVHGGKSWDWSFYFPNPAVTVSSLTQLSSSSQVFVLTEKSPTLAEAYRKIDGRLSRQLYIGQIQDLLWPARAPLSALREFINAYNREGLSAKTAFVAATTAPLSSFVKPTPQEVIPDIFITRLFGCTACQPVLLSEQVWQYWDALQQPGISPVVPTMSGPETLNEITFYPSQGGPVTYTPSETRGWGYLTGRVQRLSMGLSSPEGPLGLTHIRGMVSNRLQWDGTRLVVDAHIRLSGILAEHPLGLAIDPTRLRTVEEEASRQILQECLDAVRRAQQAGADPFGYARDYLYEHPGVRSQLTKTEWNRLPYTVHVSVSLMLTETGLNS